MKKNKLLTALALCLVLAVSVCAAEVGSLQIVKISNPVALYHVAEADGTLTGAFAQAPVLPITEQTNAVENARILAKFARDNKLSGDEKTPDDAGEVLYAPLSDGLYLVVSLAPEPEFTPFLVSLPTRINGEDIYNIKAEPKEEQPEPTTPTAPSDPTVPTEPGDPDHPDIPQTGFNQIPKYILLALGGLLFLSGAAVMLFGREKRHE